MAADLPESSGAIRIDDDGVIRLDWTAGGRITERAAKAAFTEVERISADRRRPMIVNMALTASVDRGARKVFAEPGQANRIALIGQSPVDRVIANFVLGVFKPPCPTRFFTSESAAMTWLRDASSDGLRDRAG